MKKFTQRLLSLLMLLAACSVGWANSPLIVHDGTTNNSTVPFDGWNADNAQHNQLIYPAAELSEMSGNVISEMVFYIDGIANNGSYTSADRLGTWTVSLGETDATTLSDLDNSTSLTQVYQGYFDCSSGTLTLVFDNEYLYNGGNLLVDLVHAKASYNRWYFLGETISGASYTYGSQRNFLPKTSFSYSAPPTCFKPTGLAVALTPGNGSVATLSWTAGADETAWQICLNDDEDHLVEADSNPFELTGLTREQAYTAKVRANCGDEQSAWSSAVSFTPSDAYSVTLNDGTATNSNVPVYGYYVDNQGTTSEFILPSSAEGMSSIQYGSISKLTFYLSSPASASWGDAVFKVYLKEVSNTTISALEGPDACTVVYTGSLDATQSTMEITFDQPFVYLGGNLLIGTYVQTKGTWKSATFYGVSASSGASYCNKNSSSQSFLPKVTIDYIPGEAPSCMPVSGLSASNIQAHSAELNWTAGGSESEWKLYYKKAAEEDWGAAIDVDNNLPYTLEGLDAATTYQFKVVAVCGEEDESDASAVVSFMTGYAAPFEEKFNASSAPANWAIYSGLLAEVMSGDAELTSASGWSFGTSNNVFDSHARANIYGTSCNKWLVTPAIEVGENMQLSFDLALTVFSSSSSESPAAGEQVDDKFVVLISTDNKQSWSVLRQWDNAGSEYVFDAITNAAEGQFVNIDLSEFAGQGVVIAFYGESTVSNGDNNLHIDNVAIKEIPSCLKPTDLAVDNIGAHSAQLRWSANSGESAWKLFVKKASEADFAEAVVVEENPYILESLDAATSYQFKVVAVCGEENESEESAVASFITACDVITIDADHSYSENFDALTVASSYTAPSSRVLPTCWNAINTTTYSSYQAFPTAYYYSSTNYANSTPNSLKFYSYYSSYSSDYDPQPQYAILPEMTNLAGKQITLQAKGATSTSTFKIGTMTNPADATTFTLIKEQNGLTTSYQEFTYNIPNTTTDSYVAIMIEAADEDRTTNGVYIDDIVIANPPACPKPTDLVKSNVLKHSVQLGWTENGEATAWDIAYKADGETNFTIQPADANPYTLTGLDAETDYVVKVRANCEGSESVYTAEINFTTAIACATPVLSADSVKNITANSADVAWGGDEESYIVSYRTAAYVNAIFSEGFENGLGDWSLNNCHSSTGIDASAAAAHSGSKGFKFYYRSNPPQYLISPELNKVEAGMLLSFYYKNSSTSFDETFQVGYSTTDNAIASFNFGGEITASDGNWHLFSEALADGVKYVCIKLTSDDQFYLYIDDVTIGSEVAAGEWVIDNNVTANSKQLIGLDAETLYEVKVQGNCGDLDGLSAACDSIQFATAADCQIPDGLAASNITASSAQISWNDYGQTGFNLKYKASDASDWTQVLNITNEEYVINNLSANTAYEVQIQPVCNPAAWSASLNFRTECETVSTLPWNEDFEKMDADIVPLCWDNSESTAQEISSNPERIWGVYSYGGNKMIRMYNYLVHSGTALINSPSIVIPSTPEYELVFDYAHNASCGDFKVKVSEDGGTTFVDLGTYTKGSGGSYDDPGSFTEISISLADYAGKSIILQFFAEANYGSGAIFVDNVRVREIPSCLKPTELMAALTVGDGTVATLNWAKGGSESAWILEYGTASDFTGAISVNVSGATSKDLTDLTPETTYYARVKADCGGGDESEWSDAVSFEPTSKIQIGSGNGTNNNLPVDNFYKNSLTQQIYTVAELGTAGAIVSIDFYKNNVQLCIRDLNIYMVSTNKNSFADATDWISVSENDLVFSGEISFADNAWTTIELQHAFNYDGVKNVAIIIDDNTGSYNTYTSFLVFDANNQALAVQSDGTDYNPFSPSSYNGTLQSSKNQIRVLKGDFYALKVGASGYATYFNADNAYIMPNGVVGHVFSVADGLQQAYESGDIVPANVPLVLQGGQGEYSLIPTVGGESTSLANDLIGVNNEMTIVNHADTLYYVLSLNAANEVDSVGFYWMNETGAGDFTMPAHKAYLTVYNGAGAEAAPRFYLFHGENNATWLNNLQGVDGTVKFFHNGHFYIMRDSIIYDATGRKVRELK